MSEKPKTPRLSLWVGLSFLVYIMSFAILQLLIPDKNFSDLENRKLSGLPTLSKTTLLDGSFAEDFETYIADQFPFRNTFISLKSYTDLLLQKKENNGVYIGKDGYFLQDFAKTDFTLASKNAAYINQLSEDFPVYMALAPTATKVLEDKLPAYAMPYDEGEYIRYFYERLGAKVHKVPLLETLSRHKNEAIYYKTDHHWTTLGAYYGYLAFCESAKLAPYTLDDFNIETVSEAFYGTLFSKGNFTFATPDELQLFYPKLDNPVTVTYEATQTTTHSLYNYDHLTTKDKYSVFLDNNHPLIRIQTGVKNGRKLLVLKDSYANCFIPFLTAHYEEIQVLDLRLLNIPVKSFAKENEIDDILLLYNVQNFGIEGKLSLLTH